MLYLNCDVRLLADVLEAFRNTSISYYRLDLAKYIPIGSNGWDAMRLTPGIAIDLTSYNKILEQFETSKRGG